MNKTVVEVHVKAVFPTSGGCGVFLGNDDKTFVIYVDQTVGAAISMFIRSLPKERPQTHDLIANILTGLGAQVERVVINDFRNRVYYARLILSAENEIHERKLMEIDARPSDSIAIAVQQGAPIYVSEEVWEGVEDMADVLEKMEEGGFPLSEGEPLQEREEGEEGGEEEGFGKMPPGL